MSEQPQKHKTLRALGMVRRNVSPPVDISAPSTENEKNHSVETPRKKRPSVIVREGIGVQTVLSKTNPDSLLPPSIHKGSTTSTKKLSKSFDRRFLLSLFFSCVAAALGAITTVNLWKVWREEAHVAHRINLQPQSDLIAPFAQTKPSLVRLRFASQPSGAQVFTGQDDYVGTTPCEVQTPSSSQRQEYRFQLQGFAEQVHGIMPDQDRELSVSWPEEPLNNVHSPVEAEPQKPPKTAVHGAKREESLKTKPDSLNSKNQPSLPQEKTPQAPSTGSQSPQSPAKPPYGELIDPFAGN